MNYFSVVLRIIFLMCIKNYFSRDREFIFWSTTAGLAFEVGWFKSLTSLGDHFEKFVSGGGVLSKRMPRRNIIRERSETTKRLSSFLQNLSGASSLSLEMRFSDSFVDRRFNRGDSLRRDFTTRTQFY